MNKIIKLTIMLTFALILSACGDNISMQETNGSQAFEGESNMKYVQQIETNEPLTTFVSHIRIQPDMPEFTFIRTLGDFVEITEFSEEERHVVITILDEDGALIQEIDCIVQGGQASWATAGHEMMELQFDDFNFDGFLDMWLITAINPGTAGGYYASFWLWDSELGQFVRNYYLSQISGMAHITVDEDAGQVRTHHRLAAWMHSTLYYEYWNGEFVLVREVVDNQWYGFIREVWDWVSPFEYRQYVYRDGEFELFAWTTLPADQITFQATDEIQITISHNPDSLFPHLRPFIEFEDDFANQRIAFMTNIPVANFRYIEINGAEIEFIVEEDLFVIDELAPNTPFVVHWMARGSMPHRGFAFDDENGNSRYFMFHYDARGYTAFSFGEFDGTSAYLAMQSIEIDKTHGFQAVLNAYAELERSEFAVLDEDLISLSYFVARNHYIGTNFGWDDWSIPRLMYAFHDMNGDGVPELFIGGAWGNSQIHPSLIAVYTLQGGVPVPLIYEWSNNIGLDLLADIHGDYIIHTFGGRMGIGWDTVYRFDEKGNFLESGGVFLWQRNTLCDCCYTYVIEYDEFYKTYGDRFSGNDVLISVDEYNALLVQWGIRNNARHVELVWEFLLQ